MAEAAAQLIVVLITLGLPLFILVGAWVIGSWQERRHLDRLDAAEQQLQTVMLTDLRHLPANWEIAGSALVCGEVVIANDRFKTWLAKWINLFGGRVAPFETLVERARREAVVRMQQEALRLGCNAVWNVRLETMTVRPGREQAAGIEVLAYGTGLRVQH